MNIDLGLVCTTCGSLANADDEFCEGCGAAVAEPRDVERDHLEIDLGIVAGVTDRGLVHRRNDDAMFVACGSGGVVAVVCDGVSSSQAPQIAAQLAASVIGRELLPHVNREGDRTGPMPAAAIAVADHHVGDLPWTPTPGRSAPSCTAVAAIWDGTHVSLAWAGDSRAYWVSAGRADLLTSDHSWAQEQVDSGSLTAAEAAADRRAHMITRWLGDQGLEQGPGVATIRPTSPGRLVLCSDGLWNLVGTKELAQLVGGGLDPLEVALILTRTALDRGGDDNITVAVLEIQPVERDLAHPSSEEPT